MKKLTFLFMGILMLGLFGCEKESLGEMAQGPEVELRKSKGAACSTALMIQGMVPATSTCSVTDMSNGNTVVTFGNGTAYVTLSTSKTYFVDIQGSSAATFSWCSCGNNIGSVTIPAGGFYLLNTSGSSSNYTLCSF